MKRAIYSISIFVILFLTACGTDSKNNQKGDTTNTIKVDTLNNTQPIVVEEKKLTPNDITVKLFFKGFDLEEGQEGGPYKGEVEERESFRKEHKYTLCYDSESFNRLEILGNGKALSIEVTDNGKKKFSKENFELKDKIKFTEKDIDIGMGTKITITIKQNETVLFKGKIDSQGCM